MSEASDTIAAIATPPGAGGIAIVRLSGPQARVILSRLFRPSTQASDAPFAFRPRHMHHGRALDGTGAVIDEALAVFMPGPHSFTGEDVCELHCHGGPGVSAALLEAALGHGARGAGPGEFTRRAFLNGRLDLAQAEAVAELISAPTREGARLAAAKLDGSLSREVRAVRSLLDALRIQVTLAVDFPDEEAELLNRQSFREAVVNCAAALERLLNAFARARLWREGATVALTGRVNAGKSSLLNALLGRERAIVSDSPGTTRDYIEESVNLGGLPVRLVDTAGLRADGGVVEQEGINRSRAIAGDADLVLHVVDATRGCAETDAEFLRRHRQKIREGRLLLVLNKTDALSPPRDTDGPLPAMAAAVACLCESASEASEQIKARELAGSCCLAVSAKQATGLDELAEAVSRALHGPGKVENAGDVAPNLRQSQLLGKALHDLNGLREALLQGAPPDILGVHLEGAAAFLAGVTGTTDNEALLDQIFSSFCIGK
ncbi:MAG: tRNA uridine-5-carboxymethylaminomethyl(34) synthesis GTPase MnmE [Desulfovibrio sp.]|jgi:tRNA modification GTPase|nr:tRNA uridine-5-carboxymethylaminomethyl(34) synthesis GTPase MnmE [Desulfovibrio sp.]